jgi:hypothetical protein
LIKPLKIKTMGTINKGILGGFNGTVGTVVGSTWKGKEVMRSRMGKRTGTSSPKQLEQRSKFKIMMQFLHSFSAVQTVLFHDFATGETGPNAALSYNLRNGITGTYPDLSIDYTKVLVSRGSLPNVNNPAAAAGTAGKLNFTWTGNGGTGTATDTDQAILLAYCPATGQSVYTLNGAARSTGTATLDVTVFSGKSVETWVAFITAGGGEVSSSLYAGTVAVV